MTTLPENGPSNRQDHALNADEATSIPKHASTENDREETDLWALKRQRQKADMVNAGLGRQTQNQLSWFSADKARHLKIKDSPY
ncbi:hypothetical protein [Hydrogenophaga sp. BPS33]|uniref:hypothetical protein n=1 Tax=Hydrogenophaga sp. BPS33 TaxID=2651974 RepID=UPI0013201B45|nr:hypothetical protein [Hydrogenophaga sp. BPS33]QHE84486.1 hypothetical protein F9K07_06080 [Hydrogenophaga sp. BPS33]